MKRGSDIMSLYGSGYAPQEAVLLINLGSPSSASVSDVKAYLDNFLMDERVISTHPLFRYILVKWLITPHRSPHSARNYEYIWDKERQTFPLIAHSADLAEALSREMARPVALAMRYGEPEMDDALKALHAIGAKRVVVMPLYPHYTRSSFETASLFALERNQRLGLELSLRIVRPYYEEGVYRKVIADSVRPYLDREFDRLIVSLHGIPLSHLSTYCKRENGRTDYCLSRGHTPAEELSCYRLHCERTFHNLKQDLRLSDEQIELAYQSRLGNHEWIKPYLSERIKALPSEGVRRVMVVCPGFICDCLETLHEIDVEYRESFIASGGEEFVYIPCLNSSPDLVEALASIIKPYQSS